MLQVEFDSEVWASNHSSQLKLHNKRKKLHEGIEIRSKMSSFFYSKDVSLSAYSMQITMLSVAGILVNQPFFM